MTKYGDIRLRGVLPADLPVFFTQQRDSVAVQMAAFTAKDPDDRPAFDAHWTRILADETVTVWTVLAGDEVAAHVLTYEDDGRTEASYWLGREYWRQGVATTALAVLLDTIPNRPLYSRAAKDNAGSLRVLTKCGFVIAGAERGFANGRGEVIDEVLLMLR